MSQLSPQQASEMADNVYRVVDGERSLKLFMMREEFSQSIKSSQTLTAEIGSRFVISKDAFGVCVYGGKGYEKDIFIIFRGSTKLIADWLSNGRVGVQPSSSGWPVHIGFNTAFKSMQPQIKNFLKDAKFGSTVHFIGHSLGGAVATIAANWVVNHLALGVKLYTFGAPKPGLMMFANQTTRKIGKKNIFRVYHATDPVPMVPLFPYMHPPLPGFGHYIPSSESIVSSEAHDRKKYVRSVSPLTWAHLERRKPPYAIESAVKLWLESKFPVHAGSYKIFEWINAAIIYVTTKLFSALAGALQLGLMGTMTVADTLAWILLKGYDFSNKTGLTDLGRMVMLLVNKIMQVLGMGIANEDIELTQAFLRNILYKLTTRMNEEAKRVAAQV